MPAKEEPGTVNNDGDTLSELSTQAPSSQSSSLQSASEVSQDMSDPSEARVSRVVAQLRALKLNAGSESIATPEQLVGASPSKSSVSVGNDKKVRPRGVLPPEVFWLNHMYLYIYI